MGPVDEGKGKKEWSRREGQREKEGGMTRKGLGRCHPRRNDVCRGSLIMRDDRIRERERKGLFVLARRSGRVPLRDQ